LYGEMRKLGSTFNFKILYMAERTSFDTILFLVIVKVNYK